MAAACGQYDLNACFMGRAKGGNVARGHLKILVGQGAVNIESQ
jgi:hypothetical protein